MISSDLLTRLWSKEATMKDWRDEYENEYYYSNSTGDWDAIEYPFNSEEDIEQLEKLGNHLATHPRPSTDGTKATPDDWLDTILKIKEIKEVR
jgi:hypothetical protein